ncbi:MAG: hypothetical protein QXU40_02330 [Candidatus Pacearchaeota archaeon]
MNTKKGLVWKIIFFALITLILILVLLITFSGWAEEEAKKKDKMDCINHVFTFCEEWSKFLFDEANKPNWWINVKEKCEKVQILEPNKESCEVLAKVR